MTVATPARAAAMARGCDATIVFAVDFSGEEIGPRSLTLPGNQDELIAAIAKANRRTIVVLETAGAVTMPWLAATGAVLEAWYPGSGGADAIADILLGEAVPSGRLPVTFPNTEADLPKPVLPGTGLPANTPFTVKYPEGAAAGYKGFADRHITPLFPFGFGLSGTHVAYDNVKAVGGAGMRVAFDIRNDGARDGIAVPQLYLTARNSRALRRLLGWSRQNLKRGTARHVVLHPDPRLLADFDVSGGRWKIPAGIIRLALGQNADDVAMSVDAAMAAESLPP